MRGDQLMGRRSARTPLPAGASCRRSGAHGQPPWAGHAIAARERGTWRCGASMWVLMIVLASCQDVAEQPGPIEPVTFAPEYPSLHTVPARPQLSYTVEQKRAIVDMLIADRANARYTEGVVRYRAGLSSEPPLPAPALAAASPESGGSGRSVPRPRPRLRRGAPAPAIIPETEFQQEKDSLDSFMRDMVNGRTGSQGPANPAPAGRPDANAAPLGTSRAGAGASELIAQPAAYPPRSQVVVLAMPPDPASLPAPRPAPPLASTRSTGPGIARSTVQVLTAAAGGRSDPGRPGAGRGLGHAGHGVRPGRRAAGHAG